MNGTYFLKQNINCKVDYGFGFEYSTLFGMMDYTLSNIRTLSSFDTDKSDELYFELFDDDGLIGKYIINVYDMRMFEEI